MMGLRATSISSETAAKRAVRAVNVECPNLLDRLREAFRSRHFPNSPPVFRHATARRRIRHPYGSRTARAQRCADHDDLYSCPQPGTFGRPQSHGRAMRRRFLCRSA